MGESTKKRKVKEPAIRRGDPKGSNEIPARDITLGKVDEELRNVEIKARASDLAIVARRASAIADRGPIRLFQDDIYFRCPEGRLKLRRFSSSEGELIFYARADTAAAKESRYRITPTSDPDHVIRTMADRYGVLGQVRKKRTLFLAGNARIHLDEVEGLGSFVEIEVVLN
jgi:predicted adenylyl cyclase CyaB